MKDKTIICYHSFSGNTEEISEIIGEQLLLQGYDVATHLIGVDRPIFSLDEYSKIFLGTFTWDMGSTPDEVKDFVLDLGYKPSNMYIFGTGDTQFGGDELFCKAVDKLAFFYNSPFKGLKIEQSPRGSQERVVENWINDVIKA